MAFVNGCSGHGYWMAWDAVITPDPGFAPAWPSTSFQKVTWGPTTPITEPNGGPAILEEGRYGLLLLDSSGETVLFPWAVRGPVGATSLRARRDARLQHDSLHDREPWRHSDGDSDGTHGRAVCHHGRHRLPACIADAGLQAARRPLNALSQRVVDWS